MKGQKGFAIAGAFSREQGGPTWRQVLVRRIKHWKEQARQRRQLALLDEAALKDLGLSRAEIMREIEQPFWNDPNDPLMRK